MRPPSRDNAQGAVIPRVLHCADRPCGPGVLPGPRGDSNLRASAAQQIWVNVAVLLASFDSATCAAESTVAECIPSVQLSG